MKSRLRAAVWVVVALACAGVFLQAFPDLSARLRVVAQQAYYFRQYAPNVGSDGG
jgi:hypothetical protein